MDDRTLARRRALIWPWLAILLCPAASEAQAHFDNWTVKDGLPQNSVNDIHQTRDGYLWLATFGGLVRFDGVRFVVFDRGTPGVGSLRVRALLEDRTGALWAGTDDGMLMRFQNGRFTTFDSDDGYAGDVRRIDEDAEGVLWITSVNHVTRYDGQRFDVYRPGDLPHDVRPRGLIGLQASRSSLWWSQSAAGVYCLVRGRVELCLAAELLPDRAVVGVSTDQRGAIWVHTARAGVVRRHEEHVRHYTVRDGLPPGAIEGLLFEDRNGTLWFSEYGRPLYRVRDGTNARLFEIGPLSMYEDQEGSIWFGFSSNGLRRVRHHAISMYSREQGLSSNNVYALLRDRQGRTWVGTWGGGGLNRIAHDGIVSFRTADGLPAEHVTSLFEDRAGRLFVGTAAGIAMITGERVTKYPDPMGWLGGNVWAILEDEDSTFWFATDHGLVWQRGTQHGRYTSADGLAHDSVRTLLRGAEGQLWVGTSRGFSRLQNGVFTSYTERDGFVGNHVRALAEHDDALWIGTHDGGLYRLANGRLTRYTTADGLFDNSVFQILDDGLGHFWMGSNRGISRVSRRDLNDFADGRIQTVRSVAFGIEDGMTTLECNGGRHPAGLRMPDGTLWLPTQGGVAVIAPATVRANPHPPPVRIEEVRVGSARVVPTVSGVEAPPDRNSFAIQYTALSFIKPEQIRFKYRLVGLDDDWVDAGRRRTAAYYRIPPGQYTFQVIAANSDGVWNTEGDSLAIVVLAPIWRQGWFLTLLAVSAIALVVTIDRRRIGRLKREHARQQAYARQLINTQEHERRRISNELHDSLGQTLFMIRQRARAVEGSAAGPRLVEGADAIADLAARAYDEMKDIAYNLRPYHLDKIGLTRTIEGMLRRVNRACGLEITADIENVDGLFSADAEINVYRIVQEGVNNIVRHAAATEASVTIRRHAPIVEIEIRDNGVGFSSTSSTQKESGRPHFGLTNLQERARTLNGGLTVRSRPGNGTTLLIRLEPGEPANGP